MTPHPGDPRRAPDRPAEAGPGDPGARRVTAAALWAAAPALHFPGLHPDAARWLVERRDVAAVGLDTPSIDHGQSSDFMSHRVLYEAGIPGIENVARLDELPPAGAFVVALPMKIRGGTGAPIRIAGVVPAAEGSGG